MSGQCARRGCGGPVRDGLLLCPACRALVPLPHQRAVWAALRSGGMGSAELAAAQDAAVRALNGEPGSEPGHRSPAELWEQSGGSRELYLSLLRESGHVLGPGDDGYDPEAPNMPPCGWGPSS